MTIRFDCQFCGKTLKADDSKAGKKVKCPECEGLLTIPEPQNEPEVYDSGDDASDDDGAEERESEPRSKMVACAMCGEPKPRRAKVCPYCGDGPKAKKKKYPLATPVKRLLGAIADSVAAIVVVGPGLGLLIASGDGDDSTLAGIGVLLLLVGIMALVVLQIYLLLTRSQSIGKFLVKTQIFDYEERVPAGFVKTFLLRGVVNQILGTICSLYSLIDVLMVFGDEHRCLHDRIAGTYVVDIS
ncbi:MAG: RDD family protein [Planctomycetes bacterium]|nr:RDD family protein [Planctomycetota bacterium]